MAKRGRPRIPVRVVKSHEDGTYTYSWRDTQDSEPRTERSLGGCGCKKVGAACEPNLTAYSAHVGKAWRDGVLPKSPKEYFGEVDSESEATASLARKNMTLREYIGDPKNDKPGPFFSDDVKSSKTAQVRAHYQANMERYGPLEFFGDIPMRFVTEEQLFCVVDRVLRCPNCSKRARDAGRKLSDAELRADREPFDGACPRHIAEHVTQEETIRNTLNRIDRVFETAFRTGVVTTNLAYGLAHRVDYGSLAEPTTNDDWRTALRIDQFEALRDAHPAEQRVIPSTMAPGQMRVGEFWGLCRGDFPPPPEDPLLDPEIVRFDIRRTYRSARGDYSAPLAGRGVQEKSLKGRGKTRGSTGFNIPMSLGRTEVRILNDHLRYHMKPDPEVCQACADEVGIWRDYPSPNPHDGCGLDDKAPLIDPRVLTPQQYNDLLAGYQVAAGLEGLGFRITTRAFRCTGATLLCYFDVPIEIVMQKGRWRSEATIRKHYLRLYEDFDRELHNKVWRATEVAMGRLVAEDLAEPRMAFLERRVTALTEECSALQEENERLRNGLGLAERPDLVSRSDIAALLNAGLYDPDLSVDDFREACEGAASQRQVLTRLGRTPTDTNYKWLRHTAAALGERIPPPRACTSWSGIPDTELIGAHGCATNMTQLLAELGFSPTSHNRAVAKERLKALGLAVPTAPINVPHAGCDEASDAAPPLRALASI